MFTGIIQFIKAIWIDAKTGNIYLYADEDFLTQLSIGCSIAIDGICLTVVEISNNYCRFEISNETFNKTNLKYYADINDGKKNANVELGVKFGDHLDGHLMSGHVFSTGVIKSLDKDGSLWIKLEPDDMTRVSFKGSITLNGVSLTVAEINIKESMIRIALIPETLKRTTFSEESNKTTDLATIVNVEFDIYDYNRNTRDHSYFMRLAIIEGEFGKVTAPPNPWVGCVIVKNDTIISKGFHEKPGCAHAEIVAIDKLKPEELCDSIVYTTLEPCVSFNDKRTKSCADILIECKVKTVVIGLKDPDIRVGGKGIEKLRNAGIQVLLIEDLDQKVYNEVKFSLRQYIHQRTTNLPYITVKIALTADGCYRDGDGNEKWITHAGSRQELYKLWAESQIVILGAGTVQYDNPELTISDFKHNETSGLLDMPFNFKKVVVDGYCLTSTNHKLFSNQDITKNAHVVTSNSQKWKNTNVKTIEINDTHNIIDILHAIQMAMGHDIMHILIEGGGILHKSFLEAGLVNEIVIFRGSKIFGNNGHHWNIPKINIDLVENKFITHNGENNIMERYIVKPTILTQSVSLQPRMEFDNIDAAITAFANGAMIIVMDDESRENEGDLVVAASKMTEYQMTEMINNTSGIICAPMDNIRAAKLNLSLVIAKNSSTDKNQTPFASSVDHKNTSTGISSKDRLLTVKALADEGTLPLDLNRPGHILPLISNPQLLEARKGHTEASVALCHLASIYPRVAVIGELKNQDGTIKNRQQCFTYARNNSMMIISIEQLTLAMQKLDNPKLLSQSNLPTEIGDEEWKQLCFDSGSSHFEHLVFVYPSTLLDDKELLKEKTIPLRIHSECFTGDVLKSKACDCGPQLTAAMKFIANNGEGVIIFPANHEGRGIGRRHKVAAYDLKDKLSIGTFEANKKLGFSDDARTYDDIPKILTKLGINKVELLTENPIKIDCLGDRVVKTTPILTSITVHNERYLDEKRSLFNSQTLPNNNSDGNREKTMNKAFPEVDDFKRNGNFRVAIVHAAWHENYITRIRNKLKDNFVNLGLKLENIKEYEVPGSAELSYGASLIAQRNLKADNFEKIDGVIVVGILIKGDTFHFEGVNGGVFANVGNVRDMTGLPIINAVMACLNFDQVEERITGVKSTLEYLSRSLIKLILDKKASE